MLIYLPTIVSHLFVLNLIYSSFLFLFSFNRLIRTLVLELFTINRFAISPSTFAVLTLFPSLASIMHQLTFFILSLTTQPLSFKVRFLLYCAAEHPHLFRILSNFTSDSNSLPSTTLNGILILWSLY